MSGAQHDINDVGEPSQDFRQRLQRMFDSFVGREQAEGEQDQPAFNAELANVNATPQHPGTPFAASLLSACCKRGMILLGSCYVLVRVLLVFCLSIVDMVLFSK